MSIFKKFIVTKKGTRFSGGETNFGLAINPSDGTMWIKSEPYDSNSLYPLFDKKCTALLQNKVKEETVNGFITSAIVAKGPCLQTGQNTGKSLGSGSSIGMYGLGSRDHNLENDKVLEMSSNMFRFKSTSNKDFNFISLPYNAGSYYPYAETYLFIEGNDFSNPDATATGVMDVTGSTYESSRWPVYVDNVNKYIYFVLYHSRNAVSTAYYKSLTKSVARASYTTNEDDGSLTISDLSFVISPGDGGSYNGGFDDFETNSFYYCGKNNDNTLMFLETVENTSNYATQTSSFEDRSSKIFNATSYDVGSSTSSSIATIETSSFTDSTAATKAMLRARPSQFVPSPISGEENVCYAYYPIANDSFEISFAVLTWDKSANSNAGSMSADNCSMTYSSGVPTDYIQYPTKDTGITGNQTRSNSFITESGGNYFLHYLPSYSSPDSVAFHPANSKNIVSYQINSTDFSSLTYHSSFQINACDFVHLNSSRTKIAVVQPGALKIYTWNNGWNETASESGDFVGVTQDDNGRIIGLSSTSDNTTATPSTFDSNFSFIEHKVHLVSDSLPSTVTLNFADENLVYTGSNISTSVNVSAYDDTSARIAKSVELSIDGHNSQFTSNSSNSIVITTTTSSDTNVPITITGPGPVGISASFDL